MLKKLRKNQLLSLYNSTSKFYYSLQEELVDIMTWQELYDAGLKVPAIIKYRKLNPSLSLTEAKNFVENYIGE